MKNNNRCSCFHFVVALFLLSISMFANAAHINSGGGLIYDTELNITWLQEASIAASQTFNVSGVNPAGYMERHIAQRRIAAMKAENNLGFAIDYRSTEV